MRGSRARREDGVILVLALVISLVLLVLIFSFHSAAMQGKREVSRSYLGDAASFLAESAVQEAFVRIQQVANWPGSIWYKRFEEASDADNDTFFELGPLTTVTQSKLVGDLGVLLSARARIIVLARDQTEPREKVGQLEVEAKAVVPLDRKHDLTRRVIVRHDFKGAYLAGSSMLFGYTLFVKDIRAFAQTQPSAMLPDEPLLVVKNRRTPQTAEENAGQLYLGTGSGVSTTSLIQLLPPGRKGLSADEISFLKGIKLRLSPTNPETYELGSWDQNKQAFVDDNVGADKAKAIVTDILRQLRAPPDGRPFTQTQIDGVTARVLGAKMKNEYLGADPRAAGLDIYINDPGYSVEGNLYYPYWFRRELDFQFAGGNPPTKPATQAAIVVSAVSFLNKEPAKASLAMEPLPPRPRTAPALTDEERKTLPPRMQAFIAPMLYSRFFAPNGIQRVPEEAFRQRFLVSTGPGHYRMRADGIVGLLGDLTLDGDIEYQGQGAVVVVGKLNVKGSIVKSRPSDQLILVSRGTSVTLPGGKRIEAAVHALCLAYPEQACTLELGDAGPLEIMGSLAVDKLDSSRLRTSKNFVEYDENLAQYVFHTSFSNRVFLWVSRGDERHAKENIDG